jgi:hypothetical protein
MWWSMSNRSRAASLVVALLALVGTACGSEGNGSPDPEATPNVVDVTIDYQQGSRCYSAGYPRFRLGIDPERQVAWLDFESNNEPDIVRSDDAAYFRAASVPGFEDQAGWIRAPVDPSDPLNEVVRLTALGELSYTLLIPETPISPLLDDFNALRSRTDGNEALLDESDPQSPFVRWTEDADGNVVEITVQPQDPQPLGEQRITITPIAEGMVGGVSPPPEAETVDLAEMPASTTLLSSGLFDPACRDPESPGDVEADRQCVRDATGQMTVRDWSDLQATGFGPGISAPCP